jgi:RNA polymerase sigma factor (TIGR02999 family)
MSEITRLLNALPDGVSPAQEELALALYNDLRSLARQKMAQENPGHTLQPTALVNEVWLRLVVPSRTQWRNRVEFFCAAAEAMRRILVDHARKRQALKRGGQLTREELHEEDVILAVPPDELLAVNDALDDLAAQHPMAARLVKLRYYVGMTMNEAAAALDMNPRAAERLWTFSRAWLKNEIRKRS